MWNWIRSKFTGKAGIDPTEGDYEKQWAERMRALEERLGPAEDSVFHSPVPLYLGGFAAVVEFRHYVRGHCYVTVDLCSDEAQVPNKLGNFELMICTREPSEWAPSLIARLAKYTLDAKLEPGETMDIGPALPDGATTSALLFAEPDLASNRFSVSGRRAGLLLCVTITKDELAHKEQAGSESLLRALRHRQVLPFSDLQRASVTTPDR